jgi:hypothetical protein
VEGVEEGELSAVFLAEIMVETGKLDLQLAGLEVLIVLLPHPLLRVHEGVEGFEVGHAFRVV